MSEGEGSLAGQYAGAALVAALVLSLGACSPPVATPEAGSTPEPAEEVELARLMTELQRHGAKLGYALEARNRPLADFYLHELEEVYEELSRVEEYEGMPIAQPAGVILVPALEELASFLDRSDPWAEDPGSPWRAYEALIEACNRCHLATEHAFLRIVPARGEPPFNQSFEPLELLP